MAPSHSTHAGDSDGFAAQCLLLFPCYPADVTGKGLIVIECRAHDDVSPMWRAFSLAIHQNSAKL
jgi:hypothetical protein